MPVADIDTQAGGVSIEWIAGIVRCHNNGAGFGTPFTFSLTMTVHGREAVFFAGQGTYTPKTRRAIRDAMHALGVTSVHYERRGAKDGGARQKILVR